MGFAKHQIENVTDLILELDTRWWYKKTKNWRRKLIKNYSRRIIKSEKYESRDFRWIFEERAERASNGPLTVFTAEQPLSMYLTPSWYKILFEIQKIFEKIKIHQISRSNW